VWYGVGLGLAICLVIGGVMIGVFYGYGNNVFSKAEDLWEGIFSLIASLLISVVGAAMLRISKLQEKWRVRLAKALETQESTERRRGRFKRWAERYAMFILPLINSLREGLECVIFVAGVGLSQPASSFPLAVITGLAAGILVGVIIYKSAGCFIYVSFY
jgi:high-affinity iron transporter